MNQTTGHNPQAINTTLKTFIINNFLFGADQNPLQEDDSFLEQGIIDSTGILELVAFVEETYNLKVKDDEMHPDNLDSLRKLEAFIQQKLAK